MLVLEVSRVQISSIKDVHNDQIAKLDPILNLLINYIGQIKEQSIDVAEALFKPLFEKILLIGIPKSMISEIEKNQLRII